MRTPKEYLNEKSQKEEQETPSHTPAAAVTVQYTTPKNARTFPPLPSARH